MYLVLWNCCPHAEDNHPHLHRLCWRTHVLEPTGSWRVEYPRNALRTQKHCQEAKWALSLVAPTVPCRPGLQNDFTLVERFLLAIDELDCEIPLKYINVGGHRMGHPA